ncbi:M48 family metallopeptidase [Sphaerisporangium perillae]|uniref:M48 family metallopeptidase n=1 Tax=Sphaerisporangium perillae TaxID=2935860 RepID=UPI0020104980|nr:M48 family metallopeptidase [Sphaerisporangium perillae]
MDALKKITAVFVSLVVHGITLMFIVLGASIIYRSPGFLLAWAVGGLLIAIGALLFPRPRRLPADAEVLARSSAPELYGVARRVAEAVRARPPAAVAVRDLEVASEYVRVGWRLRPVLVVGLPLWLVLSARQRVVLLARTYTKKDDHGLLMSGALWTLAQWRESLMSGGGPLELREEAHNRLVISLGAEAPRGSYQAAGTLGRVVGYVLGWPALLLERALLWLARPGDGRDVQAGPAPLEGVATEAEAARLTELIEGRRFLAPVQAAALRGATISEIRESTLARAGDLDERAATARQGERLLDPASSAAIDEELSAHYARAVRGFGLIS